MASYITHYLPSFRSSLNSNETSEHVEALDSVGPGQIKYIAVIDVSSDVRGTKEELDSELNKKLITFVHGDTLAEISSNVKIRLAGLMQGVYAFSLEFITPSKAGKKAKKPMVIRSEGESFVVVQIEETYNLICSIASSDKTVTKQLQYILNQQHVFFKLFHKTLTTINKEPGVDVLRDLSTQWWSKFLFEYNLKLTTREIKWPNTLNYMGFNTFIMEGYKKSSISIPKRVKDEFRNLILDEELIPHGLIINSFAPAAKKLGLIHVQSMTNKLEIQSLINVYNLMEFEYIMQATNRRNVDDGDESGKVQEEVMGFMNPMNLTNNLVVQPWNKMSDMIRGGSTTDTIDGNENMPRLNSKASRSWLSMPNVFGNSSESGSSIAPLPDLEDGRESVNLHEETFSRFLYGIQLDHSISRKLVYLPTKEAESDASEKRVVESEYQLVTYFHEDIYITLIYDSLEASHLDDSGFYQHLSSTIFEPLQEEIVQYQSSTLGTSTNSMTTLNLANIDNSFLYTVFDFKHMNYTSSIPLILDHNSEKYPTIVNIHDQLIKISENFDFTAHEFYHKFALGNKHDWMSYIIKYGAKLIVIIKNNSKNSGNTISDVGNIPPEERTMVNQITGLVSDYASLGFLDNLGDDVKYWLGQVIDTE